MASDIEALLDPANNDDFDRDLLLGGRGDDLVFAGIGDWVPGRKKDD